VEVHASCAARAGAAVLLRGPPGAGKSDLTLRLVADGFTLVADDWCLLEPGADGLNVSPPPRLAGLIEVRGLGILRLPHLSAARLALVVDLVPAEAVERLPDPDLCADYPGPPLPLVRLAAFEVSAARKVALALSVALGEMRCEAGAFVPAD